MSPHLQLGVVAGLKFESDIIRRRAAHEGIADRILVGEGLGRAAARAAANALIAEGARALLSFGIAGGLDPAIECGTTVIAIGIKAEDLGTRACTPEWAERLHQALRGATPVVRGDLAYAAAILGTGSEKAAAFAATGALAADMESYGIAEAAHAANVSFAAVRIVADTALEDLPSIALHAMAPDGSLKLGETLKRVARQPGQIPHLLRLGRSTARARRRLADLAAIGIREMFWNDR